MGCPHCLLPAVQWAARISLARCGSTPCGYRAGAGSQGRGYVSGARPQRLVGGQEDVTELPYWQVRPSHTPGWSYCRSSEWGEASSTGGWQSSRVGWSVGAGQVPGESRQSRWSHERSRRKRQLPAAAAGSLGAVATVAAGAGTGSAGGGCAGAASMGRDRRRLADCPGRLLGGEGKEARAGSTTAPPEQVSGRRDIRCAALTAQRDLPLGAASLKGVRTMSRGDLARGQPA